MRAHEAVRSAREDQCVRGTVATTLTLYIGYRPTYYLLQVGDSRYYVWREGALMQMTRDQTMRIPSLPPRARRARAASTMRLPQRSRSPSGR